jgi:hypothetical protein
MMKTQNIKSKQKNFSTNWTPKIHSCDSCHKLGGGQIHQIACAQTTIITYMEGSRV